jgi:hypothetical protein
VSTSIVVRSTFTAIWQSSIFAITTAALSEDGERAATALKGIVGKRLTYRSTDGAEAEA